MKQQAQSADAGSRQRAAIPLQEAGPPLDTPLAAAALKFQTRLEASQWQTPEQHLEQQMRQLGDLVRHAREHVPFYRKALGDLAIPESGPVSPDLWRAIPPVSRRRIQEMPELFHAGRVPEAHGRTGEIFTSGSTGTPLRVRNTELGNAMHNALTLRAYLWHGFRFPGSMALIRWFHERDAAPPGISAARWTTKPAVPFPTGPLHMLDIAASVEEQADWLMRVNPDYLAAFPTALFGIIQEFRRRGQRPPRLKGIQTFGETVSPDLRASVRDHLGIALQDIYSSQEMGIMAIQCPDHPVYHVQPEAVFLEILDENDRPARTGETGRVVVTHLHNFAMPILRYDHGDYAAAGEPCRCSRGLPVLDTIAGRVRNLFTLPDGRRFWPTANARFFHEVAPVRQYRVIQTSVRDLEVEMVCDEHVNEDQQAELIRYIRRVQPAPFNVKLKFVDNIPRTAGGKYEEFICRLPLPGGREQTGRTEDGGETVGRAGPTGTGGGPAPRIEESI